MYVTITSITSSRTRRACPYGKKFSWLSRKHLQLTRPLLASYSIQSAQLETPLNLDKRKSFRCVELNIVIRKNMQIFTYHCKISSVISTGSRRRQACTEACNFYLSNEIM